MKYCSKCGSNLEDDSKFCGKCGHQLKSPNMVDEAEVDKNPIEKDIINKSSGRKKKIWIFVLIAFSFCILLLAVFTRIGPLPSGIDIYKYENFKNKFFKTILTINSCEIESIEYNGEELSYVERGESSINLLPLPTRTLIRNLKNLPDKDVIISDHSCVNIHLPELFSNASDNVLDQVCYIEMSDYFHARMVFENNFEPLTLEGFGSVEIKLDLYHLAQRDDKFHALLTIGYDIVDGFWLGPEPENPKETVHTEIRVYLEIKK